MQAKSNAKWLKYRAALKEVKACLTIAGRINAIKAVEAAELEFKAASDALTAFRKAHPGR